MSPRAIDHSHAFLYRGDQQQPLEKQIENPQIEDIGLLEKGFATTTVARETYLPSPELIDAVQLATVLGRPLLLQGDPGCGKTRLAHAVAYELGLPLEECYIKSTSKAQDLLYTYDALNRLYDAQIKEKAAADEAGRSKDPRNYITFGPLGRAILRSQWRRSVVLIDEIDKADLDFPNDLLLELDRMEFRIPELGNERFAGSSDPARRPIVIITHNEEKALPAAFLRRCIYFYVEMPKDEQQLLKILKANGSDDVEFNRESIRVLLALRSIDLEKKPGLSELLDWAGYLRYQKMPKEDLLALPYIGALVKSVSDQARAREEIRAKAAEAARPVQSAAAPETAPAS